MTDVTEVKGVGPKTAEKLKSGGFDTAEKLAKASIDDIINLGIGKATASKIIKNAAEVSASTEKAPEAVETKTSAEPQKAPVEEKPKKEPKKKKPKAEPKKKEPKPAEPVTEPEVAEPVKEEKPKKQPARKPKRKAPEEDIIATKKKKGVQITKVDKDEVQQVERIQEDELQQRETWVVKARELSEEEKEARKRRQKRRAEADTITREIPKPPQPVKAIKTEKKKKTERPVKKVKQPKEIKPLEKKVRGRDLFYAPEDVFQQERIVKPRGLTGKTKGEPKPRSIIGKGTVVGHSVSYRRSRRNIHTNTLIVKLVSEYDPESVLGKPVEIVYPDTNSRIKGSITRSFGKRTSKKVLVRFEKGVRTVGLHQPVVAR